MNDRNLILHVCFQMHIPVFKTNFSLKNKQVFSGHWQSPRELVKRFTQWTGEVICYHLETWSVASLSKHVLSCGVVNIGNNKFGHFSWVHGKRSLQLKPLDLHNTGRLRTTLSYLFLWKNKTMFIRSQLNTCRLSGGHALLLLSTEKHNFLRLFPWNSTTTN